MKELTPQILAMYLGCRFVLVITGGPSKGKYSAAMTLTGSAIAAATDPRHESDRVYPVLILRRLEDMTEEEARELCECPNDWRVRIPAGEYVDCWTEKNGKVDQLVCVSLSEHEPKHVLWLLSKSFDLFGLIDAGLAIDAKTLSPSQEKS